MLDALKQTTCPPATIFGPIEISPTSASTRVPKLANSVCSRLMRFRTSAEKRASSRSTIPSQPRHSHIPLSIPVLCSCVSEGSYRLAPRPGAAAVMWDAMPTFMNAAGDSSLGPIVGVLQIEQRCPARPARALFVVSEKLSRFELTILPLQLELLIVPSAAKNAGPKIGRSLPRAVGRKPASRRVQSISGASPLPRRPPGSLGDRQSIAKCASRHHPTSLMQTLASFPLTVCCVGDLPDGNNSRCAG